MREFILIKSKLSYKTENRKTSTVPMFKSKESVAATLV